MASIATVCRSFGDKQFAQEGDAAASTGAGTDGKLRLVGEVWRRVIVWGRIQSRRGFSVQDVFIVGVDNGAVVSPSDVLFSPIVMVTACHTQSVSAREGGGAIGSQQRRIEKRQ